MSRPVKPASRHPAPFDANAFAMKLMCMNNGEIEEIAEQVGMHGAKEQARFIERCMALAGAVADALAD